MTDSSCTCHTHMMPLQDLPQTVPLTTASPPHGNSASAPMPIGIVDPDKQTKLFTIESRETFFKPTPTSFATCFKRRRN